MLSKILNKPGPHLSFEFFPPKEDSSINKLYETITYLSRYQPDFVSVTWGAGGSTVRKSLEIAGTVTSISGVLCIAHFTGLGMTKASVDDLLVELARRDIHNILVLRGDIPHHLDKDSAFHDGFQFASELVKYIRSKPENQEDKIGILVAGCPEGHPDSNSWDENMDHTAHKVEQGAEGIITQLFFDNAHFYRFRDAMQARNIHVPIIAGIMIVTRSQMIKKIIELSGCSVPDELTEAIKRYALKPQDMEDFGIQFAIRQIEDLWNQGVRHFHCYTMNRSAPIEKIILSLKDKLCPSIL